MSNLALNTIIQNNPMTRVFVSEIELENGSKTNMLSFFDSNTVGFEEMFIGIKRTLFETENAKSLKSELFQFDNGNLKQSGIIYNVQNNKKLSHLSHGY